MQDKSLTELRAIAKELGLKSITKYKKSELIVLIEENQQCDTKKVTKQIAKKDENKQSKQSTEPRDEINEEKADTKAEEKAEEKKENWVDAVDCEGVLEVLSDGYGFLRCENYLSGNDDVYVGSTHIRKFGLKTGDLIKGKAKQARDEERHKALIYINEVNGDGIGVCMHRVPFERLTPIYPDKRLRLESKSNPADLSIRMLDLVAPIGKGQRGLIVAPPKAGKTTFLKALANAITENNNDVYLIVLLIDERPEEVTDMKRSVKGDVIYSTFDEQPEHHTRVAEMALERARRLCEHKKDVVIIMDSITRLARAYNLTVPSSGRTLSGGIDPSSLYKPKHFFGSARNIEEGGSITIIASALVDTGSRMDDVIYEEFKGTGNMELHLSRDLANKRIFPAIDIEKSSTRKEDLLFTKEEQEASYSIRKLMNNGSIAENTDNLIGMMKKTLNNEEFIPRLKDWLRIMGKNK